MTHAAEPSPGAAGAAIVRRAMPVDVPIQWQANGTARVAPRVNLEFVLWAREEGMRPEEIVRRLPALDLADVYAVIAYALRHPEEMEDYLLSVREMEERARVELDALHPDRQERMARIRARHAAMQRLAAEDDMRNELSEAARMAEFAREEAGEDGELVNSLLSAEGVHPAC